MATQRIHTYHAEAEVLRAKFRLPLQAEIRPQAYVNLPGNGGYLAERSKCFRLESVVKYESGYTQVAGNPSDKPNGGWVTLATAVVEGLNVLDVVTADRVVAQVSTEHPTEEHKYVPRITFLGTRFENLKIAGVLIKPTLNLGFCGSTDGKELYLENKAFREQVEAQQRVMASAPAALRPKDSGKMPDPVALRKEWDAFIQNKGSRPTAGVDCSLVASLGDTGPWTSIGNALVVPEFGRIFLAELRVECDTFHFAMIRLDMGCVAAGDAKITPYTINGSTRP